jgi:hypothetical protein
MVKLALVLAAVAERPRTLVVRPFVLRLYTWSHHLAPGFTSWLLCATGAKHRRSAGAELTSLSENARPPATQGCMAGRHLLHLVVAVLLGASVAACSAPLASDLELITAQPGGPSAVMDAGAPPDGGVPAAAEGDGFFFFFE